MREEDEQAMKIAEALWQNNFKSNVLYSAWKETKKDLKNKPHQENIEELEEYDNAGPL